MNCSLCTNAKQTLSNVWDVRPFHYTEIDVMKPDAKKWRDLYEFDTPVVSSILLLGFNGWDDLPMLFRVLLISI